MPYFVVIEDRAYPGDGSSPKFATLLFKLANGLDWMEICTVSDLPDVRFSTGTWQDISHSVVGKDEPFSNFVPGSDVRVRAELLNCAAATYGYDGKEQKLPLIDSKVGVDGSVAIGCELGSRDVDHLFDEHVVFDTADASYHVYIAKPGSVCIDR